MLLPCSQEEIAKDLLSGDDEETQSSADDLTPSVTSHETTDFFPRTLRCKLHKCIGTVLLVSKQYNTRVRLFVEILTGVVWLQAQLGVREDIGIQPLIA